MDRQARRLYRQRGSHLRKTVDEDNVLVIRTPLRQISSNNNDTFINDIRPIQTQNNLSTLNNKQLTPILQHNIFNDNDWNLIDEKNYNSDLNSIDRSSTFDQNNLINNNNNNNTTTTNNNNLEILESLDRNIKKRRLNNDTYNTNENWDGNFNLTPKDIPFNKNSFYSINALNNTLNYIFDSNLLKKAKLDLSNLSNNKSINTINNNTNNNNNNELNKLLYELDISIFINLINGINKDLIDILDINMANNQLFLDWKSKLRQNKKSNMNLIQLNNKLNNLTNNLNNQLDNQMIFDNTTTNDLHNDDNDDNDDDLQNLPQLKNDNIKLNKLIDLNDGLFNLTNTIKKNKQKFIEKSVDITTIKPINNNKKELKNLNNIYHNNKNTNNNFLINNFCNLVDPYNGLLSRLRKINTDAKNSIKITNNIDNPDNSEK